MPEVKQLLRVLLAQPQDCASLPAHFARVRRQQPAQDPQQARLATAVRARDAQPLAAAQRERQAAEQDPPTALATKVGRIQHRLIVAETAIAAAARLFASTAAVFWATETLQPASKTR